MLPNRSNPPPNDRGDQQNMYLPSNQQPLNRNVIENLGNMNRPLVPHTCFQHSPVAHIRLSMTIYNRNHSQFSSYYQPQTSHPPMNNPRNNRLETVMSNFYPSPLIGPHIFNTRPCNVHSSPYNLSTFPQRSNMGATNQIAEPIMHFQVNNPLMASVGCVRPQNVRPQTVNNPLYVERNRVFVVNGLAQSTYSYYSTEPGPTTTNFNQTSTVTQFENRAFNETVQPNQLEDSSSPTPSETLGEFVSDTTFENDFSTTTSVASPESQQPNDSFVINFESEQRNFSNHTQSNAFGTSETVAQYQYPIAESTFSSSDLQFSSLGSRPRMSYIHTLGSGDMENELEGTSAALNEERSNICVDGNGKENETANKLDELNVVKENNEFLCNICLACKKNVVLWPCRHLCVCEMCARKIKLCPLCRQPIETCLPVFT